MAAADVGDAAARGQPLLDAVERRDPRLDDVGAVAGLEEALAAREHVVVVLAPAEAGAGDEGLGDVSRASAEPSASWKPPATKAGLPGSANISACSGDIE